MFSCCYKPDKIFLKKATVADIYLQSLDDKEYIIKTYYHINDNKFFSKYYISTFSKNIIDHGIDNHSILIHPNIIRLYKTSIEKERLNLQLEYGEQGDLYTYMDKYGIVGKNNKIIPILLQIICGLKYIHDNNILHLDLKLENIFMSNDIPKIGDFDFSYNKSSSQALSFRGTPQYCSPEMIEYRYDEVDTCSDIWSLGVIIYELYTNQSPFIDTSVIITKFNVLNIRYYDKNISNLEILNIIHNIFIYKCANRYNLEAIKNRLYKIKY